MAYYTVGDLIRDARERQKYSQEELSYGICTSSTLSRIENGVQVPGRRILEALTQRLGITDEIYNTYLSSEEMELYETGKRLMYSLGKHNYELSEELVIVMQKEISAISQRSTTKLDEQYALFASAVVKKHQGLELKQVIEVLLQSIRITMPEFDGIHFKGCLLTFQEITILNNIGCTYYDMGEVINAFRILFALKDYMEKHVMDGNEKAKKYPMILQNLSSWLGEEGKYQDALQLCQEGINCCIEYGKLAIFPHLLYNKAALLAELRQSEAAKESFLQAITVFQAVNQPENAENIRKCANMDYNLNI